MISNISALANSGYCSSLCVGDTATSYGGFGHLTFRYVYWDSLPSLAAGKQLSNQRSNVLT